MGQHQTVQGLDVLQPLADALYEKYWRVTVEGAERLPAGEALPELTIRIERAGGGKCPRCWTYSTGIGSNEAHPEICPRCAAAMG